MYRPKKTFKGNFTASQGACFIRVHSDQVVFGTVRWETGLPERCPKPLKPS
jgi:hypothetical protein